MAYQKKQQVNERLERGFSGTEKALFTDFLLRAARNLADEEILSLVDSMSPRRVSYSKRTVVARDGEEFPQVGVILSGGVHLAHVDSSGNNNLVDTLGPGDSLGELAAVGGYRLHTDITGSPLAVW